MSVEKENFNVNSVNAKSMHHRHSLQHNRSEEAQSNFRHTQSYRYDQEGKKKLKKAIILSPVILESSENESEDKSSSKKPVPKPERKIEQFILENEKRSSRSSKKSDKSIYTFDNAAFEGNLDKRSISSRAGSSRQPSVQSLEVVREQYCCCAKRTRCERKLLVTVIVLCVVIIVLTVVLAIVAADRQDNFKNLLINLTS
ncbi:uncharacterized protein LOC130897111 isoform X1 [Diorhabda carinulata]|uniref:uncharacterized protein LOC130897111 isoform X1 n=1 Tax=Diorhabda carinulata TaxID=1163345 RepID=UPI0025A1DED4|nr:uncharacterized protein LOC130897111 isoform X1 [Diorhabda carinulata]